MAQGVILMLMAWQNRRTNQKAAALFVLFILPITISLWNGFVSLEPEIINYWGMETVAIGGWFFLGPSLYFYIKQYTEKGDIGWKKIVPHYSVGMLFFLLVGLSSDYFVITNKPFHDAVLFSIYLQVILYSAFTVNLLLKITNEARLFWSDALPVQLRLLTILISGFCLAIVTDLCIELLNRLGILEVGNMYIVLLIESVLILIVSTFAQKHQVSFQRLATQQKKPVKYRTSNLTEQASQQLLRRLQSLMAKEKPFLDNELSLSSLAKGLEISPHALSQLLNEKIQQSFYEYINEARAVEAAKMLECKEFSHLAVIDVAYQCGFNNKSSFNNAFKKHFKLPPGQYRKHTMAKAG